MAYTQYGPWTNGSSPGISAAFLNALETFLLSLNSASYDSNITSDGSGNITAVGTIQFTGGNAKLMTGSGINIFDATGNTDLILNAPNTGSGHKIKLAVGGVVVMSIPQNGNAVFLGTVTQSGTP